MPKIRGRGRNKLISVLIPSRGRLGLLIKAINSLTNKCLDLSRIEILVRLDNDDVKSISNLGKLPFDKVDITLIIGNRLGGYSDLHIYVNEMCAISKGEFLFLFNDDSTIKTKNWDAVVSKYSGKVVVLKPDNGVTKGNTFPIVSREIFEFFGYFSLNAHNDTWVQHISRKANIEIDLKKKIEVTHDRFSITGNNNDKTYKESSAAHEETHREFFSDRNKKIRENNIKKITKYVKTKGKNAKNNMCWNGAFWINHTIQHS